MKGEEVDPYEYSLITRDGKRLEAIISTKLIDYEGERAVLGIVTDITERKRAERALRESEKIQAEAEKVAATGRLAAKIAHEINNPLAGIKNCFRLVRDAIPAEHPDRDMADLIEREIDRLTRVVRQMYKLHSPHTNRPTRIPVEDTIRDVLLMLEPLSREYEVTTELAPLSSPLIAIAPEGSLQQIVYNLTANGIQASPRGGVINIAAAPVDNDYVRISIRDQGPGIPTEVQEQVFEPFFSADSGSQTKEGIGLGLSIVKGIVEALGGRIELESAVGQGTCFHVYLPSL
jgi:signal transduction histidine kinase